MDDTINVLGPIGVKGFERRKISRQTAERFGIYTGRWRATSNPSGEVVPDPQGNIICYPFFDQEGREVNCKYRGPNKKFWCRDGGEQIFWNRPALNAAVGEVEQIDGKWVAKSPRRLIITEGIEDALALIECGFPCVMSVPNGAPSNRGEESASDERMGRFAFMLEANVDLSLLREIVLAADNDGPGQLLVEALAYRLGKGRCWLVKYPDGCKDANDVLMRNGKSALVSVISDATRHPLDGIYRLSDYPNLPPLFGYEVSQCLNKQGELVRTWWTLDDLLKVFPGEMMVITGVPGHGKSSFALNMLSNLYDTYRWRAAVFSPEMRVTPHLRDKLRSMRAFKAKPDDGEIRRADDWIDDALTFIDEDPLNRGGGDDRTLEWVLEKASEAVMRDGVRVLLIDPWNEIEHSLKRGELQTDYIGRGLRTIRQFAQRNCVLCIIVAHPTKEVFEKGGKGTKAQVRAPSAYDIDGSAHWYNKPDHVLCVFRESSETSNVTIFVRKVRFSPETGRAGEVGMLFKADQQRFTTRGNEAPPPADVGDMR